MIGHFQYVFADETYKSVNYIDKTTKILLFCFHSSLDQ